MSNLLGASTNDSVFTLLARQNRLLGGPGAATNDSEFTLLAKNNGLLSSGGGGGGPSGYPNLPASDGNSYVMQNGVWVPETGPAPSNIIYGQDDFLFQTWMATPNAPGVIWKNEGVAVSWAPSVSDHAGVLLFVGSNGAGNSGFHHWVQYQNGDVPFSGLTKAVGRFVLMMTGSYNPALTNAAEWYIGFADQTGSTQYGVLVSYSPSYNGLPPASGGGNVNGSAGLLLGTYNNVAGGHIGYLSAGFFPTAGVWYDLIVAWTPTACRFYWAPYGQTPALIGTITTNIPTTNPVYMIFNNYNASDANTVNLYIDRVEWVFELVNPVYMGQKLAAF